MSKFRKSYDSEDSFESNDDYDISRSSRSDRSEIERSDRSNRSDSDRSDRSLKNKNFISRSDNERSDRSDRSDVLDTTDEEIKIEIDKKRSKRNKPKKEVEEEVKLYIKEFDLNSMPPLNVEDKKNGVKIVVIGKPGTGKSTIIQEIIASKAHIIPVGQVFSGTEDSNQFYSSKMPGICVYNKLDMAALKKFVERQHIAKKFLQNPWAVQIIDDCTDNPKQLRDPLIQAYYKNGRHWCMMHILSLQYCLDILPNIRTNIDYTFILRETSLKNRENLWKNYASCVDNLNEFCQIMDQITNDYTALVINNRAMSNKLEDCIFWFKAHPNNIPPTWKFGCQDAWDFHRERLDPNYRETYI